MTVPPERTVLIAAPTVADAAAGRLVGRLLGCVPVRVGPATVSQWAFGLPLAPVGALLFLWQTAFGGRYRLTDRRAVREAALTGRELDACDLADVAAVAVRPSPAGAFFDAGDVVLENAAGHRLLTAAALPHADNFAGRVRDVLAARRGVDAAEKQIAARKAA